MLTRVSKTNSKDMLNFFINFYTHAELADWLYCEVCKYITIILDRYVSTYNLQFLLL